jgi:FkbM family methyltransferase
MSRALTARNKRLQNWLWGRHSMAVSVQRSGLDSRTDASESAWLGHVTLATVAQPVHLRASDFVRSHHELRAIEKTLTRPARRRALPILRGAGRGLRIRVGDSALTRTVWTSELRVEAALLALLHPGDVFYDIGANIGWYSLLAARAVGHSGKVIAFEPNLPNAVLLQKNVATNRLGNVTVIPAAVTYQNGWATFLDHGSLIGHLSKDDSEAQANRSAGRTESHMGSSVVPVVALDSWIAEGTQKPPKVLKIDVEGAEVGVLRGMTEMLQLVRPTLIIELHDTHTEVAEVLDSVGYRHALVESQEPTHEERWGAHLLAQPQDSATGAIRAHAAHPSLR